MFINEDLKMFINRDWKLSEGDDLRINIIPRLDKLSEAVPVYFADGSLAGWKIQCRYE